MSSIAVRLRRRAVARPSLSIVVAAAVVVLVAAVGLPVAFGAKDDTTLVSVNSQEVKGNGWSEYPSVSGDGNVVVFQSTATNLHPDATDGNRHVYVRNLGTGTTDVASRGEDGSAHSTAHHVALSDDGNFVVFEAGGGLIDGVSGQHVYMRDLADGQTILIDQSSDEEPANSNPVQGHPHAVSPDGRYVAFSSNATNLTTDALPYGPNENGDNIFLRDTQNGTTVLVSRGTDGSPASDAANPSISVVGDRVRVAFESFDADLVGSGDTNGREDVFVRDLKDNTTVLASRATGADGARGDETSYQSAISPDGDKVAFVSHSNTFGVDNRNANVAYVRDLSDNTTTPLPGDASRMTNLAISKDGRYIAGTGQTEGSDFADVLWFDRQDNALKIVSRASGEDGEVGNGNDWWSRPEMSDDGRFVGFDSQSTDIHSEDGESDTDVYLRDVLGPPEAVDGTPQTTITGDPETTTNDPTPSFTFESNEENSTFECRIDDAPFEECTSPYTASPLADGEHTFEVQATDASGNTDPSADKHTFTVDTAAPDTQIDSGPTGSGETRSFTFSSPDDDSATFECKVDDGQFVQCESPYQTQPQSPGDHAFAVRAVDAAGNRDETPAEAPFTTEDTTAPETTITEGPHALTNDDTPTFAFASSEKGSTFQCKLDEGEFASCRSRHTTEALPDGRHTFQVRATDAAGNTDATPASRAFTVDTVAPQTQLQSEPAGDGDRRRHTFSADEEGSAFECRVDDGPFQECASPMETGPHAPGEHTFSVRATDLAGNTDRSPATSTFTVEVPETEASAETGAPAGDVVLMHRREPIVSSRAPAGQLRAMAARRGPLARVRCDGGCKARLDVLLAPRAAEALGYGPRRVRIGRIRQQVADGERASVRAPLSGGARRRMRGFDWVAVQLRLVVFRKGYAPLVGERTVFVVRSRDVQVDADAPTNNAAPAR